MEVFKVWDKKIRNLSLIVIVISGIILTLWIIYYNDLPEPFSSIFVTIGIALLLSGLLILTRIQFVIWTQKTSNKNK